MSTDTPTRGESDLDKMIEPEIEGDEFYQLIEKLSSEERLQNVLEIGSSAGAGSTIAFLAGLSRNPHQPKLFCIEISKTRFDVLRNALSAYPFAYCYNRSTVDVRDFPPPSDVIRFYNSVETNLNKFPLSQVLEWLRQDIDYVGAAGVESGAVERIKSDHHIRQFDMVLIDGSEFTGDVEFRKIHGARIILLDDTNTFKCHSVRQNLLSDPDYELIADNQELRNGFSAFRRRDKRSKTSVLPIHFFTIVLNGEPFVRYHEKVFNRLNVPWHWHVIEGVAALKHDTSWSVGSGGRVADGLHDRGRSHDGTSEYLDKLAERYPHHVSIYRKPLDAFWDGKREMVGAPLSSIMEECLLWQVDADELWTTAQIEAVHRAFLKEPHRTAARYWCWYFVGPRKIISTRYDYAQNPEQEWLRTWRYRPGDTWFAHEPPILLRGSEGSGLDVAAIAPFTHDEMERAGAVFQHFAYATEAQLTFKEIYYGYKDAVAQWHRLQRYSSPGLLRNFLAWVPDDAIFDDIDLYPVEPLAQADEKGDWRFSYAEPSPHKERERTRTIPRVVLDGLAWQEPRRDICRFWEHVLREWVVSGFAADVIVLDRAGTAPRFEGVHYWTIPRRDHDRIGSDSLGLDRVCHAFGADLFVSTSYSSTPTTASVFVGYDMVSDQTISSVAADQEKRLAILQAAAHIVPSSTHAADLQRLYGDRSTDRTYIVAVGVAPSFSPPSEQDTEVFRQRHGLEASPYLTVLGEQPGCHDDLDLALAAVSILATENRFTVVVLQGRTASEPPLKGLAADDRVQCLRLDDDDLRLALGGSHALLYSSLDEDLGMRMLEAMACGCPTIVCRSPWAAERLGDGVLLAEQNDPKRVVDLLLQLDDPAFRRRAVEAGLRCASGFTFEKTALAVSDALTDAYRRSKDHPNIANARMAWNELRHYQQRSELRVRREYPASCKDPAPPDGPSRVAGAAFYRTCTAFQEHARKLVTKPKDSVGQLIRHLRRKPRRDS